MQNYDNFINGSLFRLTGRERITCINPSTGGGRSAPCRTAARPMWRRRSPRQRRRRKRGPTAGGEAREGAAAIAAKIREKVGAAGARHHRGTGQDSRPGARGGGVHGGLPGLHGGVGAPHRGRDSGERSAGRNDLPVPPADRRDRRHSAVELSVLPDRAQGRSGAGHRQHDRDQAERRDAAQRGEVLRTAGADGLAAGGDQRGPRARRDGGQGAGVVAARSG